MPSGKRRGDRTGSSVRGRRERYDEESRRGVSLAPRIRRARRLPVCIPPQLAPTRLPTDGGEPVAGTGDPFPSILSTFHVRLSAPLFPLPLAVAPLRHLRELRSRNRRRRLFTRSGSVPLSKHIQHDGSRTVVPGKTKSQTRGGYMIDHAGRARLDPVAVERRRARNGGREIY